ncbi:MAG: hypothetical protein AB8G15_14050 [Saprospiraceae bacterium]
MEKFEFRINLPEQAERIAFRLEVFKLENGQAQLVGTQESANDTFEMEIILGTTEYLYAIALPIFSNQEDQQNAPLLYQCFSVFHKTSKVISLGIQESIANIYSFAQFISTAPKTSKVQLSGSDRQLKIANKMSNNFIHSDGILSKVISTAPNGLETNSLALFNFLSNLWQYCIVDSATCSSFLQLSSIGSTVGSLLEGTLNLVHYPFTKVTEIYNLIATQTPVFTPSLSSLNLPAGISNIPNQWTLTIKVNDSGARNFLIAGVGLLAFDQEDKVWLTNNVRAGTSHSSTFCTVLNCDGSPADFSPLFGGGLLGAGFGITANPSGDKIYIGNFGWGPTQCNPEFGSISAFSHDGKVISPSSGYTQKVRRAQGMSFDSQGNLWICSWGSQTPIDGSTGSVYAFKDAPSAVVVYLGGDPERSISYEFANANYETFDLVIDQNDMVYVSNGGDKKVDVKSSVYKFQLVGAEIQMIASWESDYVSKDNSVGYESFKQINLNTSGEVFVAGVASSRVIKLDQDLNYIKDFTNLISAPWGVNFDVNDVMYIANFVTDQVSAGKASNSLDMNGPFGVTIIKNEEDDTAQLMTLPTGGKPVTLANGGPLYGNESHDCFKPLMRLTASNIDRAGNLWALNNWKPSLKIDTSDNPGGDGVVIFVGVAAPNV